jgi:hypothetical protein
MRCARRLMSPTGRTVAITVENEAARRHSRNAAAPLRAVFTACVFQNQQLLNYPIALSTAILRPLTILITWQGLEPYARTFDRIAAKIVSAHHRLRRRTNPCKPSCSP